MAVGASSYAGLTVELTSIASETPSSIKWGIPGNGCGQRREGEQMEWQMRGRERKEGDKLWG